MPKCLLNLIYQKKLFNSRKSQCIMQNPEVWSFHEPQSQFKIEKLNTPDISVKLIQNFYYNHLVCVVLPDSLKIPEGLTKVLCHDCEYYKVLNLNLSNLLNKTFISSFIKKGKLTLLSIGTRIDCDNCCAITPKGHLILSLTKDTYQTFGLEGQPSHFTAKNKDRFIVTVNLADPKLVPGQPCYEKIKVALERLEPFTVIISWEPPEESICPSSIAKFFHEIKNCKVLLCEPSFQSHVVYSIKTPLLNISTIEEEDIVDFTEWLGMVALDADFSGGADNYVNTYESPEHNMEIGQVRVLIWRGFYQPNHIANLIDYLRQYNEVQDKIWLSIYTQGFSDSPIIEGNSEQNYFTNGDNGNLIIFNRLKGLFCKHRCSAKRYK